MPNSATMIHASPKIDIWGGTNAPTIYELADLGFGTGNGKS